MPVFIVLYIYALSIHGESLHMANIASIVIDTIHERKCRVAQI